MSAARHAGMPPRRLAELIVAALPDNPYIDGVEIAGPGFINFRLRDSASYAVVGHIIAAGSRSGCNDAGGGGKVQVEFMDPDVMVQLIDKPEVHAVAAEVSARLRRVCDAV